MKLTQIYSLTGNYEKVFYHTKQEQELLQDKDINDGLKQVIYNSVSLAYRHQGHYAKSLNAINQAIDLGQEGLNDYDKGYVGGFFLLCNKLQVMMKLGKSQEVLIKTDEMEHKIKQAYKDSFPSLLDVVYALKAEALLNLEKIEKALEYIERISFSLELPKSFLWEGNVYKLKGDIYKASRRYQEATKYL